MAIRTPEMGLTIWNNGLDPYNSKQLGANFTAIEFHDHTPGRGRRIGTAALADNAITSTKLADSTFAAFDRSTPGGAVRRGACVIDTEQYVDPAAAYTFYAMPTADRVSNVVLPQGGMMFINFTAAWRVTNTGDFKNNPVSVLGCIHLNGVPLQYERADSTYPVSGTFFEAYIGESSYYNPNGTYSVGRNASYASLHTTPSGLGTQYDTGYDYGNAGTVRTGPQAAPRWEGGDFDPFGPAGVCVVNAPAGTYTVDVRYRTDATPASTRVWSKSRKLWVWTEGF